MENPFRKVITAGLIAGASLLPTEAKTQNINASTIENVEHALELPQMYTREPVSEIDSIELAKYYKLYDDLKKNLETGEAKITDIEPFTAQSIFGFWRDVDKKFWPKEIVNYMDIKNSSPYFLMPPPPQYDKEDAGTLKPPYFREPLGSQDSVNLAKYAQDYREYEAKLASGEFVKRKVVPFNIEEYPQWKGYGRITSDGHIPEVWPKEVLLYYPKTKQTGPNQFGTSNIVVLIPPLPTMTVYHGSDKEELEKNNTTVQKSPAHSFTRERQPQEIGPAVEKYDSKTGRVITPVEDKKE